jgi:hypothetical protein
LKAFPKSLKAGKPLSALKKSPTGADIVSIETGKPSELNTPVKPATTVGFVEASMGNPSLSTIPDGDVKSLELKAELVLTGLASEHGFVGLESSQKSNRIPDSLRSTVGVALSDR